MADDNATYGNAGDNRQSTFGRSLMNYISNNLPYGKSTNVLDNIAELNPNYKDFLKVGDRKEQLLSQHAISTAKPGGDNSGVGQVALDKNYQICPTLVVCFVQLDDLPLEVVEYQSTCLPVLLLPV